MTYKERVLKAQREIVLDFLIAADWRVTEAAKAANYHRTDFYKLMERLNIKRPVARHEGTGAWAALR